MRDIKTRTLLKWHELRPTRGPNDIGEYYLAHDIDFRSTLKLSTINNAKVHEDEEAPSQQGSLTIDRIDVVNYTQPRDTLLND